MDPEYPGFAANLLRFGELTGEDVSSFAGYLRAHRETPRFLSRGRRNVDRSWPPDSGDGGPCPRPMPKLCTPRFAKARAQPSDAELFRGQMLTEMARMSVDDGMVMQIHPGVYRSHNPAAASSGSAGTRAPTFRCATEYVRNLKPLLDRFGNDPRLTLILFTLDESTYARELAPLRRPLSGPEARRRRGGSTTARKACGASASR